MTERESYLESWDREYQRTMKVLKAFPADMADMKPNERARPMREIAWTLVLGERAIEHVLQGKSAFDASQPPHTLNDIINRYEATHKEVLGNAKNISDSEYNQIVKFPIGPKQTGDLRKADIFWMMMYDMIHHRGQLSVYLRMAGGKVPSIYGPSGDEPWS